MIVRYFKQFTTFIKHFQTSSILDLCFKMLLLSFVVKLLDSIIFTTISTINVGQKSHNNTRALV